MKPIPMTEQQRSAISQLKKEDDIKWQRIGHLEQLKMEDIPNLMERLNLEDLPTWPQFMKAIFRPIKSTVTELTEDPDQGYYTAKSICWVVTKAIQGKVDLVNDFLLQVDHMETTAQQEQAAIERLKQMYAPAWHPLIELLTPALYRKLYQIIGSDKEKTLDYTNRLFALVVQAVGRLEVINN